MAKHPLEPCPGSVDDLSWLPGVWHGAKASETIEEQWSAPAAGMMLGMFRWLREGKVWFYELLAIEPEDYTLVFRIKHFYPGMRGWEEKDESVTFDLVRLEPDEAVFLKRGGAEPLWMVYRSIDQNTISAYFEKEGVTITPEDEFRYERA